MALRPNQQGGKYEVNDALGGRFTLAVEDWVINTINSVDSCRVATTSVLTATYANGTNGVGATLTNSGAQGALILDGLSMTLNDRVLVKDQSNNVTQAAQNGAYVVTNIGSASSNWILTRAADFDSTAQMNRGKVINVTNGLLNKVSSWMFTSLAPVIGNDPIYFDKLAQSSISTLIGTSRQININTINGVATLSISDNPIFTGNGGATMPTGSTAQRDPASPPGTIRFNTSLT